MNSTSINQKKLYPFLYGDKKNVESENRALLESIRLKANESISVKDQFFNTDGQKIIDAARAIAQVYHGKGRVLTMGNGGSSCDAAHFAVEFQHPVTAGRPAFPTINLVMDCAMLSAVANDVGIEHVFVRQIDALANSSDALFGFSTSGNSKNLIAGFRKAKEMGLLTFGLSGCDGGAMKSSGLVDYCLVVPSDSIHRIQEVHVAAYHIIWDIVHTLLADRRGLLGGTEFGEST